MTQVVFQLQFRGQPVDGKPAPWRKHKRFPSVESKESATSEMQRLIDNKTVVNLPGEKGPASHVRVMKLTIEHEEIAKGQIAL